MREELKLKKWTLAKWKKEFWKYFALYVKERDKYTCFTCGKRVRGINCQAGHFDPAGACGLALYFHEDNVHCQCSWCNLTLQGNQYIYGEKLGKKKVEELKRIKIESKDLQYSKQDYLYLIKVYKDKLILCQKKVEQSVAF